VKRVKAGQSIGAVARELGISDQTLRNWSSGGSWKAQRTWNQDRDAGADGTLPVRARTSGSSGRMKS